MIVFFVISYMNKYLNILLSTIILSGCIPMTSNTPPNPKKIPYELEAHGDIRIDNYYWMRDDSRSCLLYTSPSPRDQLTSRMPSSA